LGLNALGPVGKVISTVGKVVNAGYTIHDMIKERKKYPKEIAIKTT
jgi:hypothetical protein